MNQLDTAKRAAIVRCLVEGNSIRATVRMTGAAKNTVTKLLVELGQACEAYQSEALYGLTCQRIQVDEIWSFCYAKAKNVPPEMHAKRGVGDVWTWVAIDADTKLVPCWAIGGRDAGTARAFLHDLAGRLANRIQLTSDGHQAYLVSVPDAFGTDIDYAQLVKLYGVINEYSPEQRYSPGTCCGAKPNAICGNPDPDHVSTSFVERNNLTMRMGMRRFTRLTNAFSKKIDNLAHAVALHFMHYNFARKHQTLKTTPAIAAGVTDKIWTAEDIVGLLS